MPKGPLGGPRPFSEYRILIDPQEMTVSVLKVGPFGGPRPLAKWNPPVTDEEVAECMMSETGNAFGAGFVTGGDADEFEDLSPQQAKEALETTEAFCRGTLEGMALEEEERGFGIAELEQTVEQVSNALPSGERVNVDII